MVIRKILETTLPAGSTSVSFTDADIPNSLIRTYTTDAELYPQEIVLSGTTLTIKYEAQSYTLGVALELVKAGLDIIDDLTSDDAASALSAKQGKALKDALDLKADESQIPDSLSDLEGDSTHRVVTDTQISSWNGSVNNIQYYEQNGFLSKNLLPLNITMVKDLNTAGIWTDNVYSLRGVNFTVNTDMNGSITSITANRFTTDASNAILYVARDFKITEDAILNGCPDGGSSSTYRLRTSDGINEYGEGVTVTPRTASIYIRIESSYNVQNVTFYPMLRLATVTDDSFSLYAPSNTALLNMIETLPSGGGVDYSTTEQDTGLKWTDGKDIYQKSYEYTSISGGDNIFSFDLPSDALVIDQKNTFISTSEKMYWTDNNISGNSINLVNTNYQRTVINIASVLAPYLSKATITVKYTKGN